MNRVVSEAVQSRQRMDIIARARVFRYRWHHTIVVFVQLVALLVYDVVNTGTTWGCRLCIIILL